MSDIFKLMLDDKKEGVTSFSSLYDIKKSFKGEKIGHAGTLDKFASGLMIVMIGGATKLNPVFSSFSKKYIATIEFGKETSTLDPEGDVIAQADYPDLDSLNAAIKSSIGKQKQIPPIYSAIHVGGKRAYSEARKGNDIVMPEREIEIYSMDLLSFDGKSATISCHVSKGTYIRSIARDLALKCNSRGYLSSLRRIQIGQWTLEDREKTTKELLDKSSLFSNLSINEENRKRIENGGISSLDIINDSNPEKPFGFLYFGSELFGICDKREKLRILTRIKNGAL